MKFDFLKDKKCWCFAAGIATAVVGKKKLLQVKS